MRIKANNDYYCFMLFPNINYWCDQKSLFFVIHRTEERVWYGVQMVRSDGSYGGVGMFRGCNDTNLFHTKEELLKSL